MAQIIPGAITTSFLALFVSFVSLAQEHQILKPVPIPKTADGQASLSTKNRKL
jgi:hypothetical protein